MFSRTKSVTESTVRLFVPTSDFSDCDICNAVWSSFVQCDVGLVGRTKAPIILGSFESILSSPCKTHRPIFEWFKRECSKENISSGNVGRDVGIGPAKDVVYLHESISEVGLSKGLRLIKNQVVPDHPGMTRILDKDWIDIDLVKTWKERCISSHGARCSNPMKIPHTRPAWVVDTQTNCLVPGLECDSFIALSYTWGTAQGLKYTKDTFKKLQEPNALDRPEYSSQLSNTVLHAIRLTPLIGERYIWIDALCIDHSQVTQSTKQLQLMGAIYASASLTIVAEDIDSKKGIPGLHGVSSPRCLIQDLTPFGEELISTNVLRFRGRWGQYHTRGWTYQEFKMSSRRLIFGENTIRWYCRASIWEESLHHDSEVATDVDHGLNAMTRGIPVLAYFSHTVSDYNNRALRYDEDVLPGFSGLLNTLSRTFEGGFLCGLPEMFFEAALSWQPWAESSLRRRIASKRPHECQLQPCYLPSWSWAGWQGVVTLWHGEATFAIPSSVERRETVPITTWYACNTPTATHKRRIKPTWFQHRELYKDVDRPLPPGWSRYTASDFTHHGQDNEVMRLEIAHGPYLYQHSSMMGKEEIYPWYWPFPVPEITEDTPPFMPDQTPYICCNTKRATADGFKEVTGSSVILRNDEDIAIGQLRPHNEEQLEEFPKLGAVGDVGKKVDLVAISRARVYNKTLHKEETGTWGESVTTEEVYMVLWVEWKDGVAYRLGSGSVRKSAWEGLALEEVFLVLG